MERPPTAPLPKLVVMISGNGTNLQAIIDAIEDRRLAADLVTVVSDRTDAAGLDRARVANIATEVVPANSGVARSDYDARLADVVARSEPDVVVLAGWMRLLSAVFIDRFPDRIINLHPALPGELPGLRAIERAWHEMMAGQRTRTGVTVHLVPDEGVDNGPVLASAEVPIRIDDTIAALTERMHRTEHELLVAALNDFLAAHSPTAYERSLS